MHISNGQLQERGRAFSVQLARSDTAMEIDGGRYAHISARTGAAASFGMLFIHDATLALHLSGSARVAEIQRCRGCGLLQVSHTKEVLG